MFKNRALQVTMVKTNNTNDSTESIVELPAITPEDINNLLKENTKRIAISVGAVIGAAAILRMVTEVVIITAETYIK